MAAISVTVIERGKRTALLEFDKERERVPYSRMSADSVREIKEGIVKDGETTVVDIDSALLSEFGWQ